MHDSPLECGLHVARLRRRRAQRRSLWTHLSWAAGLHSETVPHAAVESGEVEQAVPVHQRFLEWMGGGRVVLTV